MIFHQQLFTTNPLFETFRNLAIKACDHNEKIQGELKKLSSNFEKTVKRRNQLLHGTYAMLRYAIYINPYPNDEIYFSKKSASKGKLTEDIIAGNAEFEKFIKEVRQLYQELLQATMSVMKYLNEKYP